MEYGIWGLHAAGGLWGDPRLAGRHPILPPGATQMLPRAAFALSALQRSSDMIPLPLTANAPHFGAMELVSKPSEDSDESDKVSPDQASRKSEDNESNIERDEDDDDEDDENENETEVTTANNDNEDAGDDSDDRSTSSRSANNNFSSKSPDPLSCLLLDKDETVTPVLNGWVLGAYTAMLGRLSAATAALEATEIPSIPSDSDSDSDHSSYTEKSSGSSQNPGIHRGYSCGNCDVVAPSRPALRKHIAQSHPTLSKNETSEMKRCPSSGCDFSTSSRCELETHVATHVTQSVTSTGKKRTLALQRVRYRYEREEYRCSLCSYACTIEKAFQRHLRAHAKGTAPETRVSCAVCGADRSSEVDLSKHMRRHRDDRYFCCDICIFRTVQLKKLIQHRRMHTGEKPHLCPHCAYRSARRDNLRSHVRRVHKKENLYCDTFSPRGMLIAPTIREVAAAVQSPISSPSSPSSNPETAN
ncbi:RE1-silencing transcription factor-like isoform X2 [Leptopilina boulardi]|nr:RE1-silencing transcription factor-like isoform X2 [Leptopilina boulardi]XP_051172092.1 RE1-silencing transcription factor-like isoform X2 [Leptopilina boulardi]XP_051172093.1 RE1-silencing transcription factor-like isoform X2 [Leptopilina boulardi]XP_051172094.1 RE1-silencing transcription factor-like isoform X2 [Leptopilina boulardi]